MTSRRTDDSENMEVRGMITILPDSNNGDGSIEVSGKVYADAIQSNTTSSGVLIEDMLIKGSTVVIKNDQTTPTVPVINSHTFFIKDQLFQSLDSTGKTTVYQPTTTKGDLLAHDGIVQRRLNIGLNGSVLTVDPMSSTGLSWKSAKVSSVPRINLLNANDVVVADASYGNISTLISPCVIDGPGASFVFSKSSETTVPNIMTIVQTPGLAGSTIIPKFSSFSSPEIRKTDASRGDGDYTNIQTSSYPRTVKILPGDSSWVDLFPVVRGNFFLSVYSEDLEESCSFLVSKSVASSSGATVSKLASSPGINTINLQLRWQSNSPLQIRKGTVSGNSSTVVVTSNLEVDVIEENIVLTSTTTVNLKSYRIYERKNLIISIVSQIADSPTSICFLSKRLRTSGSAKYTVSGPGATGTTLIIDWNVNSGISVRKTDSSYNGTYTVQITK